LEPTFIGNIKTVYKSASSVAVYQRVSTKEKQVMGDIITSSVSWRATISTILNNATAQHFPVYDGINCCKSAIITK
jgi:hypothetical protein